MHEIRSEAGSKILRGLHEIESEFSPKPHEMKSELSGRKGMEMHEVKSDFTADLHENTSECSGTVRQVYPLVTCFIYKETAMSGGRRWNCLDRFSKTEASAPSLESGRFRLVSNKYL